MRTSVTRRSAFGFLAVVFSPPAPTHADPNVRWLDDFGTHVGQGDVSNDMKAFARASQWLQINRGGTLNLTKDGIYHAGCQRLNGTATGKYSWIPDPVIRCDNATSPIVINGNGATIRAVSGLRYGTFNPVTGDRLDTKAPYYGSYVERAVPYEGMIELTNCTGGISISNIELDGSNAHVTLGGEFGDLDRQIPGSGLHLLDNSGSVRIENVYSHHHYWDGMLFRQLTNITPPIFSAETVTITNFRAAYNGRQGMSLTGGTNILLRRCHFSSSGRGSLKTAPAAGLDIEAEGGQIIRNVCCQDCIFADNMGVGLLADMGDAKDLLFDHCTFIGTTNYSAWPNRPAMQFNDCTFVGGVNGIFTADEHGRYAAMFVRCLFTDDRARSLNGRVFGSDGKGAPFLIDLGESSPRAIFQDCKITAVHDARMVYAKGASSHFFGCVLTERTRLGSWPGGTYYMTSVINSHGAHLDDVRLAGNAVLYLNGRRASADAMGKIVGS